MIKVVTGAGASGKSSFAESLLEQSEAKRKIYAATHDRMGRRMPGTGEKTQTDAGKKGI